MTTKEQLIADRRAEWLEAKAAYGARSEWTRMAWLAYQAALAA